MSEKLVESLLAKYFDETGTPSARNFRDDLIHLVRVAKAEQRQRNTRQLVERPEYRDLLQALEMTR